MVSAVCIGAGTIFKGDYKMLYLIDLPDNAVKGTLHVYVDLQNLAEGSTQTVSLFEVDTCPVVEIDKDVRNTWKGKEVRLFAAVKKEN